MNTKLKEQLQQMIDNDQEAVRKRQKNGVVNIRLLKRNSQRLNTLVAQYGWPSISLVGKKLSKSAWILVQHSDHNVDFQKKCLQLMLTTYKNNTKDIVPMQIAFLFDRILVNEKKPQKFGSQFYTDKHNVFTYWPIADIKNVDKRRAMYGIEPFSEYVKAAKSFKPVPIKRIIK